MSSCGFYEQLSVFVHLGIKFHVLFGALLSGYKGISVEQELHPIINYIGIGKVTKEILNSLGYVGFIQNSLIINGCGIGSFISGKFCNE